MDTSIPTDKILLICSDGSMAVDENILLQIPYFATYLTTAFRVDKKRISINYPVRVIEFVILFLHNVVPWLRHCYDADRNIVAGEDNSDNNEKAFAQWNNIKSFNLYKHNKRLGYRIDFFSDISFSRIFNNVIYDYEEVLMEIVQFASECCLDLLLSVLKSYVGFLLGYYHYANFEYGECEGYDNRGVFRDLAVDKDFSVFHNKLYASVIKKLSLAQLDVITYLLKLDSPEEHDHSFTRGYGSHPMFYDYIFENNLVEYLVGCEHLEILFSIPPELIVKYIEKYNKLDILSKFNNQQLNCEDIVQYVSTCINLPKDKSAYVHYKEINDHIFLAPCGKNRWRQNHILIDSFDPFEYNVFQSVTTRVVFSPYDRTMPDELIIEKERHSMHHGENCYNCGDSLNRAVNIINATDTVYLYQLMGREKEHDPFITRKIIKAYVKFNNTEINIKDLVNYGDFDLNRFNIKLDRPVEMLGYHIFVKVASSKPL